MPALISGLRKLKEIEALGLEEETEQQEQVAEQQQKAEQQQNQRA